MALALPGWCTSLGSGLLHTSVVVSDILWSFSDSTWPTLHCSPFLSFPQSLLGISYRMNPGEFMCKSIWHNELRKLPTVKQRLPTEVVPARQPHSELWGRSLKQQSLRTQLEKLETWINMTRHHDFGSCCSKVGLAGERGEKRDWKGRMVIRGSTRWSMRKAWKMPGPKLPRSSPHRPLALQCQPLRCGKEVRHCVFVLVTCCGSKGSKFGTLDFFC